jgi:hypothetical protein
VVPDLPALWKTEDAVSEHENYLVDLTLCNVEFVKIRARAGVPQIPALREAAIFALAQQCPVLFTFDGKNTRINPNKIIEELLNAEEKGYEQSV